MSSPTYAEMIAMAHAIQPALIDLDVIARKPIQGDAMHKVIGFRAFDALEHIGWTWPDAHYPTVAPFHFLPNDGGEPPMKPGLRRAYAIKEPDAVTNTATDEQGDNAAQRDLLPKGPTST